MGMALTPLVKSEKQINVLYVQNSISPLQRKVLTH